MVRIIPNPMHLVRGKSLHSDMIFGEVADLSVLALESIRGLIS